MTHDLVIKGGSVVDGTGAPARTADVAITDGIITEVGQVDGAALQIVEVEDGRFPFGGIVLGDKGGHESPQRARVRCRQ